MGSKNRSPGPMLTRRNALKLGAGAGAAAIGASGAGIPEQLEPVEETEALGFTTAAALYITGTAAAAATGWMLREREIIGADDVPDGLGPDALHQAAYETSAKRQNRIDSSFVDQQNTIGYMDEPLYSEGKLAALDAINNGATEAEATQAGKDAAIKQMVVTEKNFIDEWSAAAEEFQNQVNALQSSDNISWNSVYSIGYGNDTSGGVGDTISTRSVTLRDGSSYDISSFQYCYGDCNQKDPLNNDMYWVNVSPPDNDQNGVKLMDTTTAAPVWDKMQTKFDDILNNIGTFVSNTYTEIQTGEITPDEYLSGIDLANSLAADDDVAMAIADLVSMNIPGDYGTKVTIELLDDDTKVTGYIAATDPGDHTPLSEGVTIEPSSASGSWYIAYLPSTAISTIPETQYNESYGIQGGEMNLWTDPRNTTGGEDVSGNLSYVVETTHGESAEVLPSEFNETTNSSGGTIYKADIADRLNQTITNIGRIRAVNENTEEKYRTLMIDQPFKIVGIEGDTSVEIQQQREPQTDTNYITEEEWQVFLDQQEELIEKYDDATSGGGGDWSPDFDVPTWGPLDSIEDWGLAGIAAVVGSAVFGNLS